MSTSKAFEFIHGQQKNMLILYENEVFVKRAKPRADGSWDWRCRASAASFEPDLSKRCQMTLNVAQDQKNKSYYISAVRGVHSEHRCTYDSRRYTRIEVKAGIVDIMKKKNIKKKDAYHIYARENMGKVSHGVRDYAQIRTHLWRQERASGLKPKLPTDVTDLGLIGTWYSYNIYGRPHSVFPDRKQVILHQCPKFSENYYLLSYSQLSMCYGLDILMFDGTQKTRPRIAHHRYPWKQIYTFHVGVQGDHGACKMYLGTSRMIRM